MADASPRIDRTNGVHVYNLSDKQVEALRTVASRDDKAIRRLSGRTTYSLTRRGLLRRFNTDDGARYWVTDAGAQQIVRRMACCVDPELEQALAAAGLN